MATVGSPAGNLETTSYFCDKQKLRRLYKNAQRKRVGISDEQRLLCQYEVLITNVPIEILPATQVRDYYRLR